MMTTMGKHGHARDCNVEHPNGTPCRHEEGEPMMCACGRPIREIRWSQYYQGIETVDPDGRVCCSMFEGDYPTPESAARQLVMSRDHARKLHDQAMGQARAMSFVEPNDR